MKKKIILLGIAAIVLILIALTFINTNDEILDISTVNNNQENQPDLSTGFVIGKEDKFQTVLENDNLKLSANLKNGEISVLDKRSSKTWYSNPLDKENDRLANGFHKISLFSQLLLSYTTDTGVVMNVGSFMGSVSRSGLSYRVDDEGIIFIYNFTKEELIVPVRYSLTDTDFVAEILTAGIQELGTNKLTNIELLPFFGAGSQEDDGYLLVPDGSGALIYFNNGKGKAKEFSMSLYGFDNGVNDRLLDSATAIGTSFTLTENVYLPVFGEKCNDDGFLAIMTDGAARASVKARSSGIYTSYNNIWSTYNYRTVGTVRLMQKEMSEKTVSIPEKQPDISVNYKILYRFLESGQSEYSDMAKVYQEYLVENTGLTTRTKEGDIPFYLDIYGHIRKTKSFLGIPKDTLITTTTVKDAENIVNELNSQGLGNIVLKYNYWMKNGYYQTIQTNAKLEKKLGNTKDMKRLEEKLNQGEGSLYLAAELVNVYKTGKGVSKYNDVLSSVANTPQVQYEFVLDSASRDPRYEPWYLIKPKKLASYYNKFLNNFNKIGFSNVAFESIGSMAYSELSTNGTSRNLVPGLVNDILQDASDRVDNIMLSGANEYAAVNATHLINTPIKSSTFDIEDASIPFFQMVFHGYNYYSLGATNLSSNPEVMVLKCLEYGAAPMYSWVSRNTEELIGSRTDDLFSADYRKWIDFAVEEYEEINSVLKDTVTLPITSHRILEDGVRETVYGNMIKVIVNYNSSSVTVGDNQIDGNGYQVFEVD
ncbi:MAG: hypothetical protein EWM47_02750 [Anaerolineaceae bacterium]|nr:MAG: hypothetical protein EWM47_02750 [Anaerolineaceae bacterium]